MRALEAIGVEIVIGEREGPRFRDAYDGRWYWNCHCNGGVFNLGHRHPRVVAALREALDHLDVGNHHLVSGWRARLAEQLADSTGGLLPYAVFTPSGSESVDVALRLARAVTGRERIVAALGAYHGTAGLGWRRATRAGSSRSGSPPPASSTSRSTTSTAMRAAIDGETAAVIVESIPATLGFPPPEPGYLAGVAEAARAAGALVIVDEVQTGLGRTGSPWYFEQEEIEPDMRDHRQGTRRRALPDQRRAAARGPGGVLRRPTRSPTSRPSAAPRSAAWRRSPCCEICFEDGLPGPRPRARRALRGRASRACRSSCAGAG